MQAPACTVISWVKHLSKGLEKTKGRVESTRHGQCVCMCTHTCTRTHAGLKGLRAQTEMCSRCDRGWSQSWCQQTQSTQLHSIRTNSTCVPLGSSIHGGGLAYWPDTLIHDTWRAYQRIRAYWGNQNIKKKKSNPAIHSKHTKTSTSKQHSCVQGPLRECLRARRFRATLLLHLHLCAFLM